jgi:hypothetical protein
MGVDIDCDTDEVDWGVDQPPLGKDVSAEDKKVRTGESALSRGTGLFGWILKTVRHYNPLIHARPLPLLGD